MGNFAAGGKVRLIGVGNILLKDEGIGVRVAEELKKKHWPPSVEVIDGGVAGFGLIDFFLESTKVFLIDAADMNLPPGTIRRFAADAIRLQEEAPKLSMHEVSLLEVLGITRALDSSPREIIIIGIQPKEISGGMELTPELQAVVPKVIEMVLKELEKDGIHPLN